MDIERYIPHAAGAHVQITFAFAPDHPHTHTPEELGLFGKLLEFLRLRHIGAPLHPQRFNEVAALETEQALPGGRLRRGVSRKDQMEVGCGDPKLFDNLPGGLPCEGFGILAGGVGSRDVVFNHPTLTEAPTIDWLAIIVLGP